MKDLIDAAAELQDFVQEQGWDFYFVGGVVVQVWGEPRLTTDIDGWLGGYNFQWAWSSGHASGSSI